MKFKVGDRVGKHMLIGDGKLYKGTVSDVDSEKENLTSRNACVIPIMGSNTERVQ